MLQQAFAHLPQSDYMGPSLCVLVDALQAVAEMEGRDFICCDAYYESESCPPEFREARAKTEEFWRETSGLRRQRVEPARL